MLLVSRQGKVGPFSPGQNAGSTRVEGLFHERCDDQPHFFVDGCGVYDFHYNFNSEKLLIEIIMIS